MDMNGIGYQGYRALMMESGLSASEIEIEGNERFVVYWGRSHSVDHITKVLAREWLKFGRAKFMTPLMRARNEGGSNFRVYAEIVTDCTEATRHFETKIKSMWSHRNVVGSEGQRELFDIIDEELVDIVRLAAETMDKETAYRILEVNLYPQGTAVALDWNRTKDLAKTQNYNVSTFSSFFEVA
jgi:hypothetical protein